MKLRESAKGRIRCGEMGENRLINQITARLKPRADVIVGPGDDCAVVAAPNNGRPLLLKTDCVVERVHFQPNDKPSSVGWKAMARTLSDFAAMAGLPQFALVTLVVPADCETRWVKEIYRGLHRAADRFAVAIVGGETSRTDGPAMVSVAMVGTVEEGQWVSRAGGKVGDALFVTGRLGGSVGGKHLNFTPRIAEALWLSANFSVHAMMDLSDGLGADLPRLAAASGVGFAIEEKALPRTRGCSVDAAIHDGEDYELLVAIAPNDASSLQAKWRRKFSGLALTRIGVLLPAAGFELPRSFHGYVHFQ
jgi:thiamine-monophosphate kinase